MGKLQQFDITFGKPSAVYQAGERIEATVTMTLSEPMKMRELVLKVKGFAGVRWTERRSTGSGKNRRTRTVTFSNSESYMDLVVSVWNQRTAGSEYHPAGQFSYNVSADIPLNVPTSFEGDFGHVRYVVEAKIDKPWKFDHKTKRPFTVHGVLDLNTHPRAKEPVRLSDAKTGGCLCCKTGEISTTFSLPKLGYVPGERIPVSVDIDNCSSEVLSYAKAKLKMYVTFKATSKSRTTDKTILEIVKQNIPGNGRGLWVEEPMQIPSLPPSDLIYCNIIQVEYVLKLTVDIPLGTDLKLKTPVIIGTVPLMTWMNPPPPAIPSAPMSEPQAPPYPVPPYSIAPYPVAPVGQDSIHPTIPGEGYPGYPPVSATPNPAAPPPSYEECMLFGRANIRDDDDNEYVRGQMDYAPVYSYYGNM